MNLLEIKVPAGSHVSSYLYDSKTPQYLLQDLVVVELPNGIVIDAGWYPEYDPNGRYVVRVYSPGRLEQIGRARYYTDPLQVHFVLEELAQEFSSNVASLGSDETTDIRIGASDAGTASLVTW